MTSRNTRPPWAIRLLWMNLAASIILPLLSSAGLNRSQFVYGLTYSLVYSNVVGVPAVWLLPRVIDTLVRRKLPLIPVVIGSILVFTTAGCMLGGVILCLLGVAEPAHYWSDLVNVLRFSIMLALVFGLGAFFYESLRTQLQETTAKLREKEASEERALKLAAEARLASLESRIHPHFLFNTLNSISSLIPVDPEKAEQIVGRLAMLLRSSLDTSTHSLIPLEKELAIVADYLEIEKTRLGGRLKARIEMPAALGGMVVPPLSIQSLAENAVKHGIAHKSGSGEVCVRAASGDGALCVEVMDTGGGFDLTSVPSGHGLDNLVERLDALFGGAARLNVVQRDGWCVVQMCISNNETSRLSH